MTLWSQFFLGAVLKDLVNRQLYSTMALISVTKIKKNDWTT